jgi:phosphoserine phosphatase RsbU/P
VASAVQARVNTAARLADLTPEQLMAAVDRDVYATTDGARYATAIYGVLAASRLTLVNAGHPAPLVISTSGHTRTLTASGPALGLIETGEFGSHSVKLGAGTTVVAYTDGVSDALNDAHEEFGELRLIELIETNRGRTAADTCAAVLDAVRRHRGMRQDQDDVTVMVIKNVSLGS